jgi:hypothetical protein
MYIQYTPSLGCHKSTINSITWYFNLQGSLLDGKFVPIGKRTIPWHAESCADKLQPQTLRPGVNVHPTALNILRSPRTVQCRIRYEKVLRRTCPTWGQRLNEELFCDCVELPSTLRYRIKTNVNQYVVEGKGGCPQSPVSCHKEIELPCAKFRRTTLLYSKLRWVN